MSRSGPGREVAVLVERLRAGDPRATGRLVSLVENGDPASAEIARLLAPHTAGGRVIGLTGPPGVGKSTLTAELVRAWRARGARVGVLAVDPSSPYTGGAILGDRVRMQEHATDPQVFIRSMSSRGHLGGLAAATPQAVRVLTAGGCDVVLIETVGVGQAEVEIATLADTVLVLLAPGMGDAVQAVKAGILEVADIFVINKADRPGTDSTYHDLQGMIALGSRAPGQWRPAVLRSVAARGEGTDEIVAALDKHERWLATDGALAVRRRQRARVEVEAIALATLRGQMARLRTDAAPELEILAVQVAEGVLDPYAAAADLLTKLDRS